MSMATSFVKSLLMLAKTEMSSFPSDRRIGECAGHHSLNSLARSSEHRRSLAQILSASFRSKKAGSGLVAISHYVSRNPFGTIGSERNRRPVARKIALPTAGAIATIGVSPAPADGRSLRSSSTISRAGTSPNRGTRYVGEPRVEDLAVVELDRLEQGAAEAHHRRPFDLVLQVVGVDDRAALERRHHAAPPAPRPLGRSTATSAQVAT